MFPMMPIRPLADPICNIPGVSCKTRGASSPRQGLDRRAQLCYRLFPKVDGAKRPTFNFPPSKAGQPLTTPTNL
eukprot:8329409-Pyramimonas_sp.AAC.1